MRRFIFMLLLEHPANTHKSWMPMVWVHRRIP